MPRRSQRDLVADVLNGTSGISGLAHFAAILPEMKAASASGY